MGLEDFEKELAANKTKESDGNRHSSRDDERRRHKHHHHSSRHDDSDSRHKRRHHRERDDEENTRERHSKRRRSRSPRPTRSREPVVQDDNDWVEKEAMTAPPTDDILDEQLEAAANKNLKRDTWMEAPSSLNVDYVQRQRPKSPPSQFVSAKDQLDRKIHRQDLEQLARDLEEDDDEVHEQPLADDEPIHHDVTYTFGDQGSQWRMTKLNAVYRQVKESGRSEDEVALERFGSLRDFDDAREEERELDRRQMYGNDYPAANLPVPQHANPNQGQVMDEAPPPATTVALDQTALNKLKAQLMKAKLRNAPNAAALEAEYEAAATTSAAKNKQSDVVVLSAVENRMLAGGRGSEVKHIENKRGRERGHVEENEGMSIEDMVRQERRTRGMAGGEGKAFAERIAKDAKFTDDLDYMDENASKLAKQVGKSEINLRNTAIGDFQKMQKILDSCPLCHHEDTNTPPAAPTLSLATRVYMTLQTEPELATGGAVIVPIQHRLNLLECDDDEWEEIRNFMKSLTRMYYEREKGVIFYENAAHMHSRRGHAALFAVPVPLHLADNAPAFFKEAILSADEEWSQHKKLIDTLANSQRAGYGKQAFRKSLVKEMPYFHVWFNLDGGLGHVIEDERRWPKGDLFAREVIGGMLRKGPEIIKKQGRWIRQDSRVESFRKRWEKFDWTSVLMG
ncbi:unnamed protein product [Aureobasidium uvarum]|uniref:Cell cycle control protein n=1 Tax=Aureobasidium uvarum TaxID=2773716 RepID=A0A9N8KK83_9PEZI|nr:unnamed protein product [Aureobasidium uvarum]